MKLGEWLKEYRMKHGLSMQSLVDSCWFSIAYVSMLEKGVNPTKNKLISPTMQTFENLQNTHSRLLKCGQRWLSDVKITMIFTKNWKD